MGPSRGGASMPGRPGRRHRSGAFGLSPAGDPGPGLAARDMAGDRPPEERLKENQFVASGTFWRCQVVLVSGRKEPGAGLGRCGTDLGPLIWPGDLEGSLSSMPSTLIDGGTR